MTFDDRFTWGFVLEVIDVLERHGYHHHDNQHTGQAFAVIGDLAQVYDGTRDASYGAHPPPAPRAEPAPSDPDAADAVILTDAEVSTVSAALEIAADYKRDRAAACTDCADQSCLTCQSRHRDARAYDQMATQMLQTARSRPDCQRSPARASQPAASSPSSPNRSRQGGWPVTTPRKEPGNPRTPRPYIPHPRPSEEDLLELREPYDLPMPEYPDRWLPRPPRFVIVVNQLRGLWPDQPRSLAEILESEPARGRDPEPDLEAEP